MRAVVVAWVVANRATPVIIFDVRPLIWHRSDIGPSRLSGWRRAPCFTSGYCVGGTTRWWSWRRWRPIGDGGLRRTCMF